MKKIISLAFLFIFAVTISFAGGDYWKCIKGNTSCYCDEGENNCKNNYRSCQKVSNANPGNNQLCKNTK